MSKKEHGTSRTPVQQNLRWNCDRETADRWVGFRNHHVIFCSDSYSSSPLQRICNFNRHYAEHSGYFETTSFPKSEEARQASIANKPITFYDSNSGKPLFQAPICRTWDDFFQESQSHGWPSFRDQEVIWDNVRVLPDGETVSVDGTHLGHNLPDAKGSRYCINLVSVAGRPLEGRSK